MLQPASAADLRDFFAIFANFLRESAFGGLESSKQVPEFTRPASRENRPVNNLRANEAARRRSARPKQNRHIRRSSISKSVIFNFQEAQFSGERA
jgi:hypothetical protein